MEPSSSSFASTSEQAATTSSSAPSLEQPTTTPSSPPEPMVWGPDYDTKMQSYIGRCVFGTNHRLGIREVRALLSSYRISRQDTIIACLDTTCYASTLQQLRRQFPQVKTYLIDLTAKKKEEDDRFDTLTSSFHGWAAEKKEEEEELRAVIKILRSYCLGSQRTFKEIIEHAREKESRGRIRAMMSGALPRVATTPTMTTTGRRNRFSEPPRRPFTASDIARYSPNARPTAVHRMPRGELANAGIPPNARPGDWFTMSYQGRGVLATIRPPAGDRIDYDLLNAEPSWVHQPEQGHVVDPRQGSVTVGDGDGNRDDRTGQTVATATNLIRELGEMREQLRDMREEANSLSAAARQLLSTGGSDRRPTTVDIVTGAIVPVSSTSAGNLASRNIVMAQRQREQQEREQQELLAAIERSLVDFNAQNSGGQGSSSSAQGGSAGDQEPSQSTIPGSTLQGDPPAPAA